MDKWERASKVMLIITWLREKEEKLPKGRELCTKDIIPLWSVKWRKISMIRGASISLNAITLWAAGIIELGDVWRRLIFAEKTLNSYCQCLKCILEQFSVSKDIFFNWSYSKTNNSICEMSHTRLLHVILWKNEYLICIEINGSCEFCLSQNWFLSEKVAVKHCDIHLHYCKCLWKKSIDSCAVSTTSLL